MKGRVHLGDLGVRIDGTVIKLIHKARVAEGYYGLNWLRIIGFCVKIVMNVRFGVTTAMIVRITAFRMRHRIVW
jgi:hypothetical protein